MNDFETSCYKKKIKIIYRIRKLYPLFKKIFTLVLTGSVLTMLDIVGLWIFRIIELLIFKNITIIIGNIL